VLAASLTGWWVAAWDNDVERKTLAWLADASKRDLVIAYDSVCMIPGFEHEKVGKQLLGRRQISVVIYNAQDARNLIAMPPCPVRLIVQHMFGTPTGVVELLRVHFGNAVE